MTGDTTPASPPGPDVAPGRDNPVVCDQFDWARSERDMLIALGFKVSLCQAVKGGCTCTRPTGHPGPHAAGTGFTVVAAWDEPTEAGDV